jgi:hypothetical protein
MFLGHCITACSKNHTDMSLRIDGDSVWWRQVKVLGHHLSWAGVGRKGPHIGNKDMTCLSVFTVSFCGDYRNRYACETLEHPQRATCVALIWFTATADGYKEVDWGTVHFMLNVSKHPENSGQDSVPHYSETPTYLSRIYHFPGSMVQFLLPQNKSYLECHLLRCGAAWSL